MTDLSQLADDYRTVGAKMGLSPAYVAKCCLRAMTLALLLQAEDRIAKAALAQRVYQRALERRNEQATQVAAFVRASQDALRAAMALLRADEAAAIAYTDAMACVEACKSSLSLGPPELRDGVDEWGIAW